MRSGTIIRSSQTINPYVHGDNPDFIWCNNKVDSFSFDFDSFDFMFPSAWIGISLIPKL